MHTVTATEVAGELHNLKRGRGLGDFSCDVAKRVGPALQAVCEVTADDCMDNYTMVTRRVTGKLVTLAASLPFDLRAAVLAALGVEPQGRFYLSRVASLADRWRLSERTVRRRIKEGLDLLAELAVADLTMGGAQ